MLKIDEKKLVGLLEDFNKLTGIKICIFDGQGREVACAPRRLCDFCEYVRSSEAGEGACALSDKQAFSACRRLGKQYRYTCHMGLTECVSPIMHDGVCIGYILIGQILGEGVTDGYLAKKAEEYGLDASRVRELASALSLKSDDVIDAAVSIMDACASYLYLNKLVHAEKSLSVRLGEYITANIAGELSVDALCRKFKLSRVDLYSCFANFFDSTPAEYVKKTRLDTACRLLETTDLRIGDVCRRVGIVDYNYFSKIFRRTYGISPRDYRSAKRGAVISTLR